VSVSLVGTRSFPSYEKKKVEDAAIKLSRVETVVMLVITSSRQGTFYRFIQ
jgi:hypothetical protein